jgi:hypothetical protein
MKQKILTITVIAVLTLGAAPILALAADEDLPVCDAFSVVVAFQRVNDQVSNVSFEWTGYDAPGYELKIFYEDNLIYQEVVYGAGTLVPVSIFEFEGNGIDEYDFYVLALDGAAVCRSAVESFYLDSIYVPPVSRPGWTIEFILGIFPWTLGDLGPGGGDDDGSGPGWPGGL